MVNLPFIQALVFTPDGRVMNQMLPFFNDYLKFEQKN
jgi:hypothetical protein